MADVENTDRRTRLAPSPTGALHLGNARTFLINWAIAQQQGQRILLRIDDLEGPRIKAEAAQQAIDTLSWLGLNWDEGPVYQTHDLSPYRQAIDSLQRDGKTYPCTCTRKEIEQAQSAPHGDDHELRYPGTCRPRKFSPARESDPSPLEPQTSSLKPSPTSTRLIVPDEPVHFTDTLHGPQAVNVQQQVGDFIIATKADLPAYQLAAVVDDARQGITDVVRGDDLLRSTARQVLLYRDLKLGPPPRYTHLPLVLGPDGHRLAKRHGDTKLSTYRNGGVPAPRLIGLLAKWCGLSENPQPMTCRAFAQHFDLSRLPRHPITFTQEDDTWLTDI